MASDATYKSDNYWYAGLIGTVVFHGLLLLFFILFIFKTPIPPIEPGGGGPGMGIEVNLGNSETGIGSEQIADLSMPDFVNEKPVKLFTPDSYVTQENSESETVSTITKDDNNKNVKPEVTTATTPTIDPKGLYKGKKNKSEGIAGGSGNQGNPNGNLTSKNYLGDGGEGNGGGTGGGVGTGNGPGNGPGTGPGISYDIKGRKLKNLAKPVYNDDDEGKIVVTVTVDKKGNVLTAKAGAKGTTIANTTLRKQCEAAALKSSFDSKSNAPIEQIGTITYVFLKLN